MLPLLFALWEFLGCGSFQEEKPKQNLRFLVLLFYELGKIKILKGVFLHKGVEIIVMVCVETEWVSNHLNILRLSYLVLRLCMRKADIHKWV